MPLASGSSGDVQVFDAAPGVAGFAMLWASPKFPSGQDLMFARFDPDGRPIGAPTRVLPNWARFSTIRLMHMSDGGYRAFWAERVGALGFLMSRSVTPGGGLGPVRIDAWSPDLNDSPDTYHAMPLPDQAYQVSWYGRAAKLRTQFREGF